MRDMSASSWLRQGSSIVFDKTKLGPLVTSGCLISLREALSWIEHFPLAPKNGADTVLVGGLETCLDLLPASDAETWVRTHVRRFIVKFQNEWDRRGLVFGFSTPNKVIHQISDDEVLFKSNNKVIRLSHALWNGTATVDVARLVTDDREVNTVGYHVRRIS